MDAPDPPVTDARRIAAKIRSTTRALRAIDGPLVVACSGGSDSTALLWLACQCGLPVVALHVQHHLRDEAHIDEAVVRENAARLAADFVSVHLDARALKAADEGVQAAARRARYEALVQVARERGGTILTAHHIEDLLETFILRLDTGSGMRASFGPREWSHHLGVPLHRPLLTWWKSELRALLVDNDIPWAEDRSNEELTYRRNAVRQPLQALYGAISSPERFASSLLGVAREAWSFYPDHADVGDPYPRQDNTNHGDDTTVEIPRELFATLDDLAAAATTLYESIRELPGRPRRDTLHHALRLLRDGRRAHLMDHRLLYTITPAGITVTYAEDPRALLADQRLAAPDGEPPQRVTPGIPLRIGDHVLRFEGVIHHGHALWARTATTRDRVRSTAGDQWRSVGARLARDGVPPDDRANAILILERTVDNPPTPETNDGILVIHRLHRRRDLPTAAHAAGTLHREDDEDNDAF